jgi:hypothetical protein
MWAMSSDSIPGHASILPIALTRRRFSCHKEVNNIDGEMLGMSQLDDEGMHNAGVYV